MWKTGHSLIKAKMKQEKAELAGEMSGHMFFKDRYLGFDDALYAAGRILEIAADANAPLSSLLAGLPKTVTTPEIRVHCPDEAKFDIVKKVTEHFKKAFRSMTWTGPGWSFPTDGAWLGPPTPSRPWCCASRRQTQPAWRRSGLWWRRLWNGLNPEDLHSLPVGFGGGYGVGKSRQ